MENKSSLTFSFCGDYEVSALSVSRAIESLVELSTVIAEKEYPGVEFRLTVKAVKPGSLEFEFVAAAALALQTLLSPENVTYAASLIEIMSAVFQIKHFLKGERPKSKEDAGEKIIIAHPDGGTLEVPKGAGVYFFDNRIDRSVTNIINAAKLSEGVTGIAVDANGKIEIPRDDFDSCLKEFSIDVSTVEVEPLVVMRPKEILFIRQADFSGELKWRFKGAGAENIVASVLDERFLDRVISGVQEIRAKMYLVADVRVTIQFGPDKMPDESKCTYEVLKVHSVGIPGEGQTELDI